MNPSHKHNPWSFNHRTRARDAFDSDSDPESEVETNSKVNLSSDDTRLIQELDISSRHETVEYKPNPWSIARINAASRPPNKEPPGQAISEDIRRKSQPQAPQGRIVDAFKIQAERKPPRAPPPLKAPKVTKAKSNTPRVSQKDQVCSQIQSMSSAEPGDYLRHDNAPFLDRGSRTSSSDTPAILSSNAPQIYDARFLHSADRFQVLSALPVPQVPAVGSCRTVPPAMVKGEPPSMPQWLASTIHSSIKPPLAQAEFLERVSSPMQKHNDLMSPESRKRPNQSPTPSPLPQRAKKSSLKRNIAVSSVSRGDRQISAYAFDDDPDANWSTVMKPEKKKSSKFKVGNILSTGPFSLRLPGITVGNSKDWSTGVTRTKKKLDTQTKKRVITYLPPPLPQRTAPQIENSLQIEEHYIPDDNVSPPGSTSAAQSPQGSGRVSPLPHADSDDLTLVGGVDEQVIPFDAGEVKTRYPKVRKLIKEVCIYLDCPCKCP
ncbi:hypothetical protein DFJ58DRAFT_706957 [Suillus subalutaceus]|uniref:uncharacterized protein n=1 Tax=Suillus subalutaceus TaxID=48586 RepID=UPI001B865719|nr:uncharacterized protein DFJ58DRAFT_706957 [Suillus subalutaceus]KAG1843293.1 hypothetical protein DFJ58DRAFT_706957 [Suillus subalutaceus]